MMRRTRSIVIAIGAGALMALVAPASQKQKFSQRDYDRRPASEFLFQRVLFRSSYSPPPRPQENAGMFFDGPVPFPSLDVNHAPGGGGFMVSGVGPAIPLAQGGRNSNHITLPQPSYVRNRLEQLTIPRFQAPALTVATDTGPTTIKIAGQQREDWEFRFCSTSQGVSEAEAQTRTEELSLVRNGALVSVASKAPFAPNARGDLTIDAPAGAPMTVYTSSGAIVVHDMTGSVRTAAPRGRTTILNSTGRVDATGDTIDFAGEQGTAILNASAEINMKLSSTMFQGSISAHADRVVRVLLPPASATPIEAIVARRKDFVCRADICARIKPE
jgi:hypothetical protein